jgi:hypothetical protein
MSAKIKKWFFGFVVLILSFSLVWLSAIKVSQAQVQKNIGSEAISPSPSVVSLSNQTGKVDYYLVYPGILPDHPLYWLKMIRDRVALFLNRDSIGKIEMLLLYSDKRLGAAKVLIEGGKVQLGVTTATKGEKYLEEAVSRFNALVSKDATGDLKDRLNKAILKHAEILSDLISRTSDSNLMVLKDLIEKTNQLYAK